MNSVTRTLLLVSLVATTACGGADDVAQQEDNILFRRAAPIGPEPQGGATQYPILLVHGFAASPTFNGFYDVDPALRADGHVVYVPETPPYQSALVRAEALAAAVELALTENDVDKVNIIAHSMGGLDSRALISQLGYGDRVATLTTISTPHYGSAMADFLLKVLDGQDAEDEQALNDFLKLIGARFSNDADDNDLKAAMVDLSEANAEAFAEANPNDDRVLYRSLAGVSNVFGIPNDKDAGACDNTYYVNVKGKPAYPGKGGRADLMAPILISIAGVVAHGLSELTPNDGLVTVESARLEGSVFLGCIPADHIQEVGQPELDKRDRRTGYDHRRFIRNMAYDLAAQGY